jgi:hypothetical protein
MFNGLLAGAKALWSCSTSPLRIGRTLSTKRLHWRRSWRGYQSEVGSSIGISHCPTLAALGPGCVKTQSDLVVMPRSTNFRIFLLSARPYASKFMVRFYRAEFSHGLGRGLPSRLRWHHDRARSNAVFTTQQPHRSSTTYRPADQKNAWHPSCNAIPAAQPTSLPTCAVARPPPNPHS